MVGSAEKNQLALLHGISQIEDETILLDGHFCLLDKEENVIELSFDVFDQIAPSVILLVSCEEKTIHQRLEQRGGYVLGLDKIIELQEREVESSSRYSSKTNCKLLEYRSLDSTEKLIAFLSDCY